MSSDQITPNSSAVISLPPGMTPEEFYSLQGSLVTICIAVAVGFGIVAWDYFNLFTEEIKLYQSSRKVIWRTVPPWAFILLRYSGLLATLPSLFLTSVPSGYCQFACGLSQAGTILVVASSGTIFVFRVTALWGNNRIVSAIVGAAFFVMVGCWIAVATQYRAIDGEHIFVGSNCEMLPIAFAPLSCSSSVAFYAVILLLTISKLSTYRAEHSDIDFLIYRDCVGYFTITLVTNIPILVIQAMGPAYDLIKPAAIPFSILIMVTMGSRVFLNLNLFNARWELHDQSLPFASYSSHATHQWGMVASMPVVVEPGTDRTNPQAHYTSIPSPPLSAEIFNPPPAYSTPLSFSSPLLRSLFGIQRKSSDQSLTKHPDKSGWI